MKLFALLFAVVCSLALVACGSKTVVGDWTGTVEGQPADVSFRSDGTMTATANAPGDIKITMTGTYKHEGETLTMTWSDIDLGDAPKELQAIVDGMVKDQLNKPIDGKMAWNDDGSFSFTPAGQAAVTFRKKEAAG